jgi:hypothetical protein
MAVTCTRTAIICRDMGISCKDHSHFVQRRSNNRASQTTRRLLSWFVEVLATDQLAPRRSIAGRYRGRNRPWADPPFTRVCPAKRAASFESTYKNNIAKVGGIVQAHVRAGSNQEPKDCWNVWRGPRVAFPSSSPWAQRLLWHFSGSQLLPCLPNAQRGRPEGANALQAALQPMPQGSRGCLQKLAPRS